MLLPLFLQLSFSNLLSLVTRETQAMWEQVVLSSLLIVNSHKQIIFLCFLTSLLIWMRFTNNSSKCSRSWCMSLTSSQFSTIIVGKVEAWGQTPKLIISVYFSWCQLVLASINCHWHYVMLDNAKEGEKNSMKTT